MGVISLPSTMLAAAILLLLLAVAPRHAAGETEYAVGDAAGWTNNGFNYLAWSQKYNFAASDTLMFNYVEMQHDVYQVNEDAFRTCEPAKKTVRVWASGRDVVNLTGPGDYYCICNIRDSEVTASAA